MCFLWAVPISAHVNWMPPITFTDLGSGPGQQAKFFTQNPQGMTAAGINTANGNLFISAATSLNSCLNLGLYFKPMNFNFH